jgi:hypothetical protein
VASSARTRFVQQARSGGAQALDRGREVGDAQGNVMQAGAALLEETGNRRIDR